MSPGTFLGLASPTAIEVAALAGCEWVLLDLEHGGGTLEQGPGLGSSLADSSDGFAVGYAKSITDITVRWAALGDTNIDGAVTFADVRNIVTARRYNQGIKADNHWYLGDFDYNDQINIRDIFYLRTLYNQGNYRPQSGSGSGSGNASGFSDSNKTTG